MLLVGGGGPREEEDLVFQALGGICIEPAVWDERGEEDTDTVRSGGESQGRKRAELRGQK